MGQSLIERFGSMITCPKQTVDIERFFSRPLDEERRKRGDAYSSQHGDERSCGQPCLSCFIRRIHMVIRTPVNILDTF